MKFLAMDPTQKVVQEYLHAHTPSSCPRCNSKVKIFRSIDSIDWVMCKSQNCSWPLDVDISSLPQQSSLNSSHSYDFSRLDHDPLPTVDEMLVEPPPLLPVAIQDTVEKHHTRIQSQIPRQNILNIIKDDKVISDADTVYVSSGDPVPVEDEATKDVIVDVVNSRLVHSNEDLNVYYSEDTDELRVSFLSPPVATLTERTWIMFTPMNFSADQVEKVIPLLEEFSKEFLMKFFPVDVKYTTKAALAKASLGKHLVRNIKGLFKASTIKSLLPKVSKPKLDRPKKEPTVKIIKDEVKKMRVLKLPKPPRVPKLKKVKLPRVQEIVASKGIKKLISRILQSCVKNAIKESESKHYKGKLRKRKLEELPSKKMQITTSPLDLLYSRPVIEGKEHNDPNEDFDLNQDDLDLHEYHPLNIVSVEYAEVPKKKRRKKNVLYPYLPAVVNPEPELIYCPEIGFWGEEEENNEAPQETDEEYDVTQDYLEEHSRSVRKPQYKVDRYSGQIEEWANLNYFQKSLDYAGNIGRNVKVMTSEEKKFDGEELIMRIAQNLSSASSDSLKSPVLKSEYVEISNSIKALSTKGNRPSHPIAQGLTIEPSLSNSDLLGDVSCKWFSILKNVIGVESLDLLREAWPLKKEGGSRKSLLHFSKT